MKEALLAAGGALSALAASACCVGPLILVSVGISGAWVGAFSALAPFQPYFIGLSVIALGAGFWLIHRRAASACCNTEGGRFARFARNVVWMKAMLWAGTALVALAIAIDYGALLFL